VRVQVLPLHPVPQLTKDTKIDYTAYMQQVDMFLSGERDYSKIEGETGPLVYPALHLYIYTALRNTFGANNIVPVQYVFAAVYLATLALVAGIYRRAGAPQLLLVPLAMSKRAHSVYMLRLFNDPLGMMFMYAAVAIMMREKEGRGKWRLASGLYRYASFHLACPRARMVSPLTTASPSASR